MGRVHRRHNHAGIGYLGRISAIAANNPAHGRPDLLAVLDGPDQVRAHIAFQVTAANGEYQQAIAIVEPAAAQPLDEHGFPAPRRLGRLIGLPDASVRW